MHGSTSCVHSGSHHGDHAALGIRPEDHCRALERRQAAIKKKRFDLLRDRVIPRSGLFALSLLCPWLLGVAGRYATGIIG